MLVSASKFTKHKILKKRTINFETVKRTHENLVLIMSDNQDDFCAVLKSTLFRPQQLLSSYVPRILKPLKRKTIKIEQKDIYTNIREKTGNRITIGRVSLTSYAQRNLAYNYPIEFTETLKLATAIKPSKISLQRFLIKYQEDLVYDITKSVGYKKTYIVFPMNSYIENFRPQIYGNFMETDTVTDPIILFLKSLRKGIINLEKYKDIDGVFFFNANAEAVVFMDLKDEELLDNLDQDILRIIRLNNFNNGSDKLGEENDDDIISADNFENLDRDDIIENKKEKIRNAVLSNIAKKMKVTKLNDFEPSTKDEKDLIIAIDNKINEYLESDKEKDLVSMIQTIENDSDVKLKAFTYIENKNISMQKAIKFASGMEKETEIVNRELSKLQEIEKTIEPEVFDVKDIPEVSKESRLSMIDKEYNEKLAKKDLMEILSSFSMSEKIPMTLDSFSEEDTSDDFDQKTTLSLKYKTDEGKILTFKVDVPKIIEDKYLYLGGNKKAITKQLIRLPIIKTKPDRVEIVTNYNKVTMERTNGKLSRDNACFLKVLNEYKNSNTVKIKLGSNSINNAEYNSDFEFEELAENISIIETFDWIVYFNRQSMQEELELRGINSFIENDMTPLAVSKLDEKKIVFIKNGKIFIGSLENNENFIQKEYKESLFKFLMEDILKRSSTTNLPTIGKSYQYTKMKIIGVWYPVFVVIGIANGIKDILKRYNVEYKFLEKRTSMNGFVEVKFKDGFFYYKDTIKNTLLLNILYMMNTESYNFYEFDLDKPYIDYLRDKLGQPQYVKTTLTLNLNLMLDPITRSILHDMRLPENVTDLILLGNTMLTHNSYRAQNDIRNFRVRGNELVYAMLYELIAKAYLAYQRGKLNGKGTDSIELGFILNGKKISGDNALIVQLLTAPNVNDHSVLNPVLEIENSASVNQKGFHGINLNSAYTLELRTFSDTMLGVISGNATPYSGSAGITRSLTYNPAITNARGYINVENSSNLNGFDMLSPTELLSPWTSTSADPARQSMQVAQTKHTMAVEAADPQLIGTGMNKTLAFMISDDLCFKAKEDGIVEKIDEENKLCILQYDNGKKDAIDLADVLVKNSNGGFYTKQDFRLAYKENEKFKKGDVLAFNPNFFTGKGKNVDYMPGALAKVAIAAGDFAFEDSTLVTEKLGLKCKSKVTMLKQVALGPNTLIHNIVKKGDKVKTGDHLIDFTSSFSDPSTSEFLANLAAELGDETVEAISNDSVKTKYSGTVVDVKVYYNKPLNELSESLRQLIKNYSDQIEKRRSALKGINTPSVHIHSVKEQTREKVGTLDYDGVLIEFYVEYEDILKEGDKITYSTALKGVVSKKLPDNEAPVSEYRPEDIIEAILTPTGIISRMTEDIYFMLASNKCLVELGKQIYEIWNDKR